MNLIITHSFFRIKKYIIDPVLELAGKYEVPCLIDYSGAESAAERMADNFPETKIIVAHLGKYLCDDERLIDQFIGIAEEHDNIFLDVSGVVMQDKIEDAVKKVGSNRVMWDYKDLNLRQIAETLGVSVGTVKTHHFNAVHRLRKLLEHNANCTKRLQKNLAFLWFKMYNKVMDFHFS